MMFHVTFFREVVAIYTAALRKVGFRILEFIAQGLGVNPDHFSSELGENQTLLVNHYPPCPDPSLTLGLGKHRDPVVINILLQSDVYGSKSSRMRNGLVLNLFLTLLWLP